MGVGLAALRLVHLVRICGGCRKDEEPTYTPYVYVCVRVRARVCACDTGRGLSPTACVAWCDNRWQGLGQRPAAHAHRPLHTTMHDGHSRLRLQHSGSRLGAPCAARGSVHPRPAPPPPKICCTAEVRKRTLSVISTTLALMNFGSLGISCTGEVHVGDFCLCVCACVRVCTGMEANGRSLAPVRDVRWAALAKRAGQVLGVSRAPSGDAASSCLHVRCSSCSREANKCACTSQHQPHHRPPYTRTTSLPRPCHPQRLARPQT